MHIKKLNMSFFSVIIPLYNKENHIENTLKSVLDQTFDGYEIIIVNDGSTDNGPEIAKNINDSRIRILNQQNQGVSAARNKGIEHSNGTLIAFLDADDYWFPNHLEELSNLYNAFPDCGIYCSRYKIKTTSKHFSTPHFNGITDDFSGIVSNYFYSNRPFRVTWTSSLAIPKEIIIKYGGFTVGVTNGQDYELWTKIGICEKVVIGNKYTSLYNYHIPGSLAKNNISTMKLMDFNQFKADEEKNSDLKSFLDIHRFFYAMLYKANRNYSEAKLYYDGIDKKNIGLLNQVLFHLPSWLLQLLYTFKKGLRKTGIDFSTYN